MAVQLMKKGFAVGMLVDRLRQKCTSGMQCDRLSSAVDEKLNLAREDVDEAERICREVRCLALPSAFVVSTADCIHSFIQLRFTERILLFASSIAFFFPEKKLKRSNM